MVSLVRKIHSSGRKREVDVAPFVTGVAAQRPTEAETDTKGYPMAAFYYMDLVESPEKAIERIFAFCDLPLLDSSRASLPGPGIREAV